MTKPQMLFLLLNLASFCSYSQDLWKGVDIIQLPPSIRGNIQEYSGLAIHGGRLYLLPQFGGGDRNRLLTNDCIYSIRLDSIDMKIEGMKDSLAFSIIKIKHLDAIKDSISKYQGYEAITFVNDTLYVTIETDENENNCYLLEGKIDTSTNTFDINANRILKLKRPKKIYNAGYESVSYLNNIKKLLAIYEYNAHGLDSDKNPYGYLIDPVSHSSKDTLIPSLYFRMTDIAVNSKDEIFGINYYYASKDSKEYHAYVHGNDRSIAESVPDLRQNINNDRNYLVATGMHYTRIVKLVNDNGKYSWKQIRRLPYQIKKTPYQGNGYLDINWEGMVLYKEGALLISDAQGSIPSQSKNLSTVLAYCKFSDGD